MQRQKIEAGTRAEKYAVLSFGRDSNQWARKIAPMGTTKMYEGAG